METKEKTKVDPKEEETKDKKDTPKTQEDPHENGSCCGSCGG